MAPPPPLPLLLSLLSLLCAREKLSDLPVPSRVLGSQWPGRPVPQKVTDGQMDRWTDGQSQSSMQHRPWPGLALVYPSIAMATSLDERGNDLRHSIFSRAAHFAIF